MIQNKILTVTFSNGQVYDIPVSAIINHYSNNVAKKALGTFGEKAVAEATEYFEQHPEQLLEYASFAMSFIDVILVAEERALSIMQKELEWKVASKQLSDQITR